MEREIRSQPEAMTTVYCPGVEFKVDTEPWDWQFLQLIIPGDGAPLGKLQGEEFIEIICQVSDTNAVHWKTPPLGNQ